MRHGDSYDNCQINHTIQNLRQTCDQSDNNLRTNLKIFGKLGLRHVSSNDEMWISSCRTVQFVDTLGNLSTLDRMLFTTDNISAVYLICAQSKEVQRTI